MTDALATFIKNLEEGVTSIPQERINLLDRLGQLFDPSADTVTLNFICTHNSRRSQLAEFLCFYIARHLGLKNINSYSGGTEGTAFNARMVAALQRAGFEIEGYGLKDNPLYIYTYGEEDKYMFSKVYDHAFNPDKDFIAITVCSDADRNCPVVLGATHRFHLGYVDPKASDGTINEAKVYDAKVLEIGSELFYLLSSYRDRKNPK